MRVLILTPWFSSRPVLQGVKTSRGKALSTSPVRSAADPFFRRSKRRTVFGSALTLGCSAADPFFRGSKPASSRCICFSVGSAADPFFRGSKPSGEFADTLSLRFSSRPVLQGVKTRLSARCSAVFAALGSAADPFFRGSKLILATRVANRSGVQQQTRSSGGQNLKPVLECTTISVFSSRPVLQGVKTYSISAVPSSLMFSSRPVLQGVKTFLCVNVTSEKVQQQTRSSRGNCPFFAAPLQTT